MSPPTSLPPLPLDEVLAIIDGAWMRRGRCTTSGIDFTATPSKRRSAECLAVCEGCPVTTECLYYAKLTGDYVHIMGGTTPSWRKLHLKLDQRYSICDTCGSGYVWDTTTRNAARFSVCASCIQRPERSPMSYRQHFVTPSEGIT